MSDVQTVESSVVDRAKAAWSDLKQKNIDAERNRISSEKRDLVRALGKLGIKVGEESIQRTDSNRYHVMVDGINFLSPVSKNSFDNYYVVIQGECRHCHILVDVPIRMLSTLGQYLETGDMQMYPHSNAKCIKPATSPEPKQTTVWELLEDHLVEAVGERLSNQ